MKMSEHLRRWRSQGWQIEQTGGGHLRLRHPEATGVAFTSKTPGDHRAIANTDAQLRRLLRREASTHPEAAPATHQTPPPQFHWPHVVEDLYEVIEEAPAAETAAPPSSLREVSRRRVLLKPPLWIRRAAERRAARRSRAS
ncbi:hypothetical protein [Falsiroseomonas sp. CW058]|uniref:hypothetical protein n=1 Tax=Falsiroseomonas sp. CW058 TaxID=3388664 RepID=UPI003D3113F5